jgi:hypothetical protein
MSVNSYCARSAALTAAKTCSKDFFEHYSDSTNFLGND